LELLSNQSSTILQTMSHGNEKLIEDIATYFQIDDEDELTLNSLKINDDNEQDIPSLDILSQKFTAYQTQLRSTIPVDKLLEVYESADQFLKEWEWMDTELDQKVIKIYLKKINSLFFHRQYQMKRLIH
jgi:predicted Rossmann fold nucleotide-binding protein DprA/Smf involved in DNA uptake